MPYNGATIPVLLLVISELGKLRMGQFFTPEHHNSDVDLPVAERGFDIFPAQLAGLSNLSAFLTLLALALILQPEDNESPLFFRKKRRGLGEIVDGEEGNYSYDDCCNTLVSRIRL
jgi:hypothetical protein